MIIFSWCDTCF